MVDRDQRVQDLLEMIRSLLPDKTAEVEDIVGLLQHRDEDRRLTRVVTKLSEDSCRKGRDKPDDPGCDRL